jgi:succinoglycan biosynthesis protein ExoA
MLTDKLSIVIPCRNEARSIAPVLDSILAQDFGGRDWEVIVADGTSDDGTRSILEGYRRVEPRIRVMDNPSKIVPAGLNMAIRAARGDIILRMDAHTSYAPDYVRRCVETLDAAAAENVGGPARTRSSGYWGRAIAAAYHSAVACGGAKFHDTDYEGWVDTVPYGCWRKSTLLRIGLFDERLIRNQDDELNLRLRRAGGRIWQSPGIVSWYQPRGSLKNLALQYFQYGFWKVAVIRKHRVPASWRQVIPPTFVTAGVAIPVAGLALPGLLALWAAMIALYLLLCIVASADCARKKGWLLLPALPLVFFAYHIAYGAGFLAGICYWPFVKAESEPPKSVFTQASR